jgi:hypothetical protein
MYILLTGYQLIDVRYICWLPADSDVTSIRWQPADVLAMLTISNGYSLATS